MLFAPDAVVKLVSDEVPDVAGGVVERRVVLLLAPRAPERILLQALQIEVGELGGRLLLPLLFAKRHNARFVALDATVEDGGHAQPVLALVERVRQAGAHLDAELLLERRIANQLVACER